MEFEWDETKSAANERARGIAFSDAIAIFANRTVELTDTRRDYGETRVRAIGIVGGNVLTVIYTDRAGVRRIISAWPSSRQERRIWRSRE